MSLRLLVYLCSGPFSAALALETSSSFWVETAWTLPRCSLWQISATPLMDQVRTLSLSRVHHHSFVLCNLECKESYNPLLISLQLK